MTLLCIFVAEKANSQNFVVYGAATPTAVITSSDANDTICTGSSVVLTTTPQVGANTYSYSVNGAPMQSGGSNIYIPNPVLSTGNQQVIVNVSNGICATKDTLNLVVLALPTPTITTPDSSVCSGTPVTFTATGSTPGSNFKVNNISVQNNGSTTFTTSSLLNGDVITVEATNAGGCVATSAPITMTIYSLPTAGLTTPDNSVCAGTSVTFTATGGTVGNNFKIGSTSVQNNGSATYTSSTITNGQSISVDVTDNNGCVATSAPITMTIFPTPQATIVPINNSVADPACLGEMIDLQLSNIVGTPPFTFEIWNTVGGNPSTLYYSVPGSTSNPTPIVSYPNPNGTDIPMVLNFRITDLNMCHN